MDLLDVLLSQGKIDQKSVNQIRIDAITNNTDVESILQESKIVSQIDFFKAKAVAENVQFKDLAGVNIPRDIFNTLPVSELKEHIMLPFGIEGNKILLAMKNPFDIQLINYLQQKYKIAISPFLSIPDQIISIIDTNTSSQIETNVIEDVQAANQDFDIEDVTGSMQDLGSTLNSEIKNAPIVKIVNTVLEYAVKFRASDVHIEPTKNTLKFRYRIDGILLEKLEVPVALSPAVVSRIKILSKLKIDEKRIPQDGRFGIKVGQDIVDLRVSSLPVVYGEKIVIRLLRKTTGISKIDGLGMMGSAYDEFKKSLGLTKGIILITGPTGSGKTQTLASALSFLNSPAVNIVTLEDPVEIEIDGVNQVQINDDVGLTFASGLRAFLRQDPNIIMVGEVRDEETARLATQASLTGHLVLSTIHTTSASGALPRLLDMGIEAFLISSTVEVIVAQRLVRKICSACKEKYEVPETIISEVKNSFKGSNMDITKYFESSQSKKEVLYLYKGKGCGVCGNTGYFGRIGIFEVLVVNEEIRSLILKKSSADEIDAVAKKNGMLSLVQDGFLKVLDQVTTIEEVYRVAKEEI